MAFLRQSLETRLRALETRKTAGNGNGYRVSFRWVDKHGEPLAGQPECGPGTIVLDFD